MTDVFKLFGILLVIIVVNCFVFVMWLRYVATAAGLMP